MFAFDALHVIGFYRQRTNPTKVSPTLLIVMNKKENYRKSVLRHLKPPPVTILKMSSNRPQIDWNDKKVLLVLS